MTDDDWVKVGIGAGALVVGLIGGTLIARSAAPSPTGLSRLYGAPGDKGHVIAVDILASSDGYLLAYDAPYGASGKSGKRDPELESALAEDMGRATEFANPEDAAFVSDDIMARIGYKPKSDWADTISWSLKT